MEKEEFKKELQKSFAIRLMYYLAIIFLIFVFFLIALTPLINKPEFISLKISLFICNTLIYIKTKRIKIKIDYII